MPEPYHIEEARFVRNEAHDANQEPMLEILRAYCLGMLKACGHVNERIKSEHFYEVCSFFRRSLESSHGTDDISRKKISCQTHILVAC
jgi:hypothetical protein